MPRWAMECDCLLPTRNGAVDHGGFFLGVRVGMHSSRHVLSASLHASYRILGRETTVHSLLQTARVQPVAVGAWCVYVCVHIRRFRFPLRMDYTLRRIRMTHESVAARFHFAGVLVSVGVPVYVSYVGCASSVELLRDAASRMPPVGDALVATSRK